MQDTLDNYSKFVEQANQSLSGTNVLPNVFISHFRIFEQLEHLCAVTKPGYCKLMSI
jgi:hypothetical protein